MRALKSYAILVIMLASLVSVTGLALAVETYDVLYVDDDGPVGGNQFQSIEEALAQANPDAAIYIAAGYYDLSVPLVPDADVAFIGEGADVVTIDGTGLKSSFRIVDVSVYIYGCTIMGANTCVDIDWFNGVYDAYLHNNAIYGAMELDTGVHIVLESAEGEVTILGNDIYDNSGYGIAISSTGSDLFFSVKDNAIYSNDYSGIFIDNVNSSIEAYIDRNEIYDNGAVSFNTGIQFRQSGMTFIPEVFITDNEIYDNYGDGILFDFVISSSTSPCDGGAVPTVAEYFLIEGNVIDNNGGKGIFLEMHPDLGSQFDALPDPGTYYIISEMVVSKNRITNNGGNGFDFYAPFTTAVESATDGNGDNLDYSLFLEKNIITGNLGTGIRYYSLPPLGAFNNLIAGNIGCAYGIDASCEEADIVNCTISGNSSGVYLDVENLLFANNIVTSNQYVGISGSGGGQGFDGDSYMQFYFNDVWGNGTDYNAFPDMTGINGNISVDPQFAGPSNAHLQTGSPCIDAGSSGAYPFVQDDLEDTPRPLGADYDMGCYEARVQNWTPQLTQPLATLNLARANAFWSCLKENLPDEMNENETALVEDIQGIMAQAVLLGNPVMTNGLMQQAQELMAQLDALLECGCS